MVSDLSRFDSSYIQANFHDLLVTFALEVFQHLGIVGNVVLLVPTAKVLDEPKACSRLSLFTHIKVG